MLKHRTGPLALVLAWGLSLVLPGCGPATRVADRDTPRAPGLHVLRAPIGHATLADIDLKLPRTLGRFGYLIEDGDATPFSFEIRTAWRPRTPLDDEQAAGIGAARTRLVVRGTKTRGRTYSLRLEAENLVRYRGEPDWQRLPPTAMFRRYTDEIARELTVVLSTGIRRF